MLFQNVATKYMHMMTTYLNLMDEVSIVQGGSLRSSWTPSLGDHSANA
jgi:hypothetical protein